MASEFGSERFIRGRAIAAAAKKNMWGAIERDGNCIGAAFGRRVTQGQATDTPALVIYVQKKVPQRFLPLSRRLPRKVYVGGDWVEVDVIETGPILPFAFTARDRPAPSGISVGNRVSAEMDTGTLGCLVRDLADGTLCLLSNNHVIAEQNAASIGDPITQPGPFDGGLTSADDIARLKRFVTINATGNQVDGAIAEILNEGDVIDQMKDNLMEIPSPDHPAVGLLFAGSCSRTLINPVEQVLSQLNIEFTQGPGATIDAEVGMNVEKVGRTTEYTTSTITEVDVTVTIPYNFGNATFDSQIATAWMSDPGDSGSIVCAGGEGGNQDQCGCGSTSASASLLGADVRTDAAMAQEFRDKVLRQTRIGAWAADLFAANEERFLERYHATKVDEKDKDFARKLYAKHAKEARAAFVDMENPDRRVTDEHFRDAKKAFEGASKYLDKDEQRAAERVFELAEKVKGRTAREALAMLEDEGLHKELRAIVAEVPSIREDDC
ncbi:MAG: hypothetical protein AAGF23_24705 [Acidobacteriota bacterium]